MAYLSRCSRQVARRRIAYLSRSQARHRRSRQAAGQRIAYLSRSQARHRRSRQTADRCAAYPSRSQANLPLDWAPRIPFSFNCDKENWNTEEILDHPPLASHSRR